MTVGEIINVLIERFDSVDSKVDSLLEENKILKSILEELYKILLKKKD